VIRDSAGRTRLGADPAIMGPGRSPANPGRFIAAGWYPNGGGNAALDRPEDIYQSATARMDVKNICFPLSFWKNRA
jgi:hypothetical protein